MPNDKHPKRSLHCMQGKHDAQSEVMRGQTYKLGETCAGYAGTTLCICDCHKPEARAK